MKKIISSILPHSMLNLLKNYKNRIEQSPIFRRSAKKIFTQIYQTRHWKGIESVSGPGSDIIQTGVIINEVSHTIEEFGIKSILDIPCGDFNWMQHVNMHNAEYLGADIVEEIIKENSDKYSKEKIRFEVVDLLSDPLLECDLIICRDCLVHLSFSEIRIALNNIKASKSKYLLTTSFTERNDNYDIITGGWRPLNLQMKPFKFPNPIKVINEKCTEGNGKFNDKSLVLYLIDDIKLPMGRYR